MERWSDQVVLNEFKISFFLDTNLLVFLIDKTHPQLNNFIEYLSESPFVNLLSSKFVILEFVGVRKRENYLRKAVELHKSTSKSNINYGALFKNIDSFRYPYAPFDECIEEITNVVKAEIQTLESLGLDMDYSNFNNDQLTITIDICLSTKISSQDSMVLISAVLPDKGHSERIKFLSEDNQFVNAVSEKSVKGIFTANKIVSPDVLCPSSIKKYNIKLMGKDANSDEKNLAATKKLILDSIKAKIIHLFLGETFKPKSPELPREVVTFKLKENLVVYQNMYLIVLDVELGFTYSIKNLVELWHNNSPIQGSFTASEDDSYISFKFSSMDAEGNEIPDYEYILTALKKAGNLVFIHPDFYNDEFKDSF